MSGRLKDGSSLIVFRADSSIWLGSGHVMRCMTLANELRRRGASIRFVCREHSGSLIPKIEREGYKVYRLPAPHVAKRPLDGTPYTLLDIPQQRDAEETLLVLQNERPDWLVVDHYSLDAMWEKKLRPYVNHIMVVDDLADRPHDCDLLLDQNYYRNASSRYVNLVPPNCQLLLGSRYVLLRPEFARAREIAARRDGRIRRILVFFGGTDPFNATGTAVEALSALSDPAISIDVVVGVTNPNREALASQCRDYKNVYLHVQTDEMANLMAAADLAIGACGSATWERCYLGLPSIVLILTEHQRQVAEDLATKGAVLCLGDATSTSADQIANAVQELMSDPERCLRMSHTALELIPAADNPVFQLLQ